MSNTFDVALIGGGIMSATLGALLHQLEPAWRIGIFEALPDVALESSDPWNNAGTGHSALAELNYTPVRADGSIDITAAVTVNEQFQVSRQFWSSLVRMNALPDPSSFIHSTPHMSFVWGEDNVAYLRKRYDALKTHPLFAGLEFSDDPSRIREWAPLLMTGRPTGQPVAATRSPDGTDIDFGTLTRHLIDHLTRSGAELMTGTRVTGLRRHKDLWRLSARAAGQTRSFEARFVFVGAGGNALRLLQSSGIPEIRGYGGFPISGHFLRSENQDLAQQHGAKVYGKASIGSPPMSVPHLDSRIVGDTRSVMFGPYAGFSPRFLKTGSRMDLFASVRWHNVIPMISAGARNLSLVRYLVGQLAASKKDRLAALREFLPSANAADWHPITAGQRVQVIKRDRRKGGVLQFGTEVVASGDGTIAGLLGASPGASTAVPIMFDLVTRCFPNRVDRWRPLLAELAPTTGKHLSDDPALARATRESTARTLKLAR